MIVSQLKKIPFLIPACIVFFFLSYFLIPVSLVKYRFFSFVFLLFLYPAGIAVSVYVFMEISAKIRHVQFCCQDMQEKINLIRDENITEEKNAIALQDKTGRYSQLKEIIEKINKSLDLDSTVDSLVSVAFSSIANSRGVCFLYLFDTQARALILFKTKKEDRKQVIKLKGGDIFDAWVLRHLNCLWVEDAKKDFRFDLEKFRDFENRTIGSLISAPLVVGHKFLGILRLDNPQPNFYSMDDLRFLMAIADIGAVALDNNELFEKTKELAIHDALTSLYAKGYFLERLKEECKRSLRQGRILSLFMIDIDHFKHYNDEFGHPAGDIVLQLIALSMKNFLKDKTAIIGRFGGEEFCVVLTECEREDAATLAEGLRKNIEETGILLRGKETKVTVSIGVASFPYDARDEIEFIIKADKAMYEAKQSGRNRVVKST